MDPSILRTSPRMEEMRQESPFLRTSKQTNMSICKTFRRLFQYTLERGLLSRQQVKKVAVKVNRRGSINNVSQPPKRSRKFASFFVRFLSLPALQSSTWAEVFYLRMVAERTCLDTQHLDAIIKLVRVFMEEHAEVYARGATPQAAKSLLEFIRLHQIDPDNSLLGIGISHALRDDYGRMRALQKKVAHTLDGASGGTPQVALHAELLSISKQKLLDILTSWSLCPSDAMMSQMMRSLVSDLRAQVFENIQAGSLVVLAIEGPVKFQLPLPRQESQTLSLGHEPLPVPSFVDLEAQLSSQRETPLVSEGEEHIVIGRICSWSPNGMVQVWVDPSERTTRNIPIDQLLFFTKDMEERARSPARVHELIEEDIDRMFRLLKDSVLSLVSEYLSHSAKVDTRLLARLTTVELWEQKDVKHNRQCLEQLLDRPHELIAMTVQRVNSILGAHMGASEKRSHLIYYPARINSVQTISSKILVEFALDHIKSFIHSCDEALDNISWKQQKCLNGALKLELSEWCSSLILSGMRSFLDHHQYVPGVIPFDLHTRPTNLEAVRSNLYLMQRILQASSPSSEQDEHPSVENGLNLFPYLIQPLREKIYPALEQLRATMSSLLLSQTFIAGNGTNLVTTLDTEVYLRKVEAALQAKKIDQEHSRQLQRIIHDIGYLEAMTSVEKVYSTDHSSSSTQTQHLLRGVKPIWKLVLEHCHHLEESLTDVVMRWEDKFSPRRVTRNRSKPIFKGATTSELWSAAYRRAKKTTSFNPPQVEFRAESSLFAELRLAVLSAEEIEQLYSTVPLGLWPISHDILPERIFLEPAQLPENATRTNNHKQQSTACELSDHLSFSFSSQEGSEQQEEGNVEGEDNQETSNDFIIL